MEVRLQKYLADNGIASRRKCEELILEGKVKVNGNVVIELGIKVDTDKDVVYYNNKEIKKENEEHVYILLNKPIGFVTTVEDQFNRETVLDLVKVNKRIVPVGRLDMFTSGALILTDDGDFIYKVTHPKHEITKTYTVTLKGVISDKDIEDLKNGVEIDDGYITKKAQAKIMKIDKEKEISRVEITIHEGKNRQVRKMCEVIGKRVLALHRAKIAGIGVKDIELGKWRYLNKSEVDKILNTNENKNK